MEKDRVQMRNAQLHRAKNESIFITAEVQNWGNWSPGVQGSEDWVTLTFVRADLVRVAADSLRELSNSKSIHKS